MKTYLYTLTGIAAAALAVPALAHDVPADGSTLLPVAYEALRDGRTHEALRQLANENHINARDPSRLINMGTANARLGRTDQAAAHYRAAIDSPIRYDLELANGRTMDSRWAARMALQQLQSKGRVTVALAEIRSYSRNPWDRWAASRRGDAAHFPTRSGRAARGAQQARIDTNAGKSRAPPVGNGRREQQSLACRGRMPCVARKFAFQLASSPPGIAQDEMPMARTAATRNRAQHILRRAQHPLPGNVDTVGPAPIAAV